MKVVLLALIIFISVTAIRGQSSSSAVEIITTYSQNEKFYLKSIPYDNEFPTLRGKTLVYEKGNSTPLYVFQRGFDSVERDSNNLILSNDGEVIFYAIPSDADENIEGLKSVTIYKHGTILRSLTETEITGCDKRRERCSLIYPTNLELVDRKKSNWGTKNYKKILKEGIDEKERFLSDFPIFSIDDTVYLTDSKKMVHLFDLNDGQYLRSESFENIFDQIKNKGRFNKTELASYEGPVYLNFPKLQDGKDPYKSLASYLGMTAASLLERKNEQYRLYSFKMSVNITRDGHIEIEDIDVDEGLPKEKIVQFFKANRFDSSAVPEVFDRWYLRSEFFSFRNSSTRLARQERKQQIVEGRQARERRMTLEIIDGVYIPKDLGECFVALDKLLPEIDRKEMRALPERNDMIIYHLSLGMWMRNNWGLHGGSRLYKYFHDKGLRDPEDMSSVVLFYYYDWLTDKKEAWKEWEENPGRPFPDSRDQRFSDTINARPRP